MPCSTDQYLALTRDSVSCKDASPEIEVTSPLCHTPTMASKSPDDLLAMVGVWQRGDVTSISGDASLQETLSRVKANPIQPNGPMQMV
jgi:hypothetical protein